ncbi:MAG: flagellin [Gemmatimonadetes bacterium]|nr:flagellin [Gemmatimonadota bacterium]
MAGITLSAAVRDSLLSLQTTTQLINRTQGRLSTGLAVSSAIDDPIKFFQAKTLSDRATDFDAKKAGIDQGISGLTAALDGTEGIESIVAQMKGLVVSAKSATSSTIAELVSQFNDLRNQIANLARDTQFQGLNLINGTGEKLTVEFSTDTSSTLVVNSVDVTEGADGLAIRQAATGGGTGSPLDVSFGFSTGTFSLLGSGAGDTIDVTFAGESATSLASGTFTFAYGSVTVTYQVASAGAATQGTFTTTQVFAKGTTFSFDLGFATNAFATALNVVTVSGLVSGASITLGKVTGQYVIDAAFTTQINSLVTDLQSALDTLRTKTKTLGSNVALLQTRLDFTDNYVNTLQTGADKLTLADLNEEGANLLALQTRQQLGIQALSFAGQYEQGILSLFR